MIAPRQTVPSPVPPPTARRRRRLLWLLRFPAVAAAPGGDAVYSRQLVSHVSAIADVRLLSFEAEGLVPDAGDDRWTLLPLRPSSKLASLASPLPNIAFRYRQAAYRDRAIAMAREADGVVIDNIGLFPLVADLRAALGRDCPPLVVVNHNHEGSLRAEMAQATPSPLMRLVLGLDGRKSARLERAANRDADGHTAITTSDLAAFRREAGDRPGLLLTPGYDGPVAGSRVIDDSTPMRLCILGARSSYHKELVLGRILAAVVASGLHRRVIVDVVGGGSERAADYPGVNFLGYVDDLAAYAQTVRLGIIPDDVGGGFKLRALSHVFNRIPMLALSRAMRGMTLREGRDFAGVADIPQLVATAGSLMSDLPRLNALQEAAFEHCRHRFDWSDRATSLVNFVQALAGTEPAGPAVSPLPAETLIGIPA